MKNRGCSTRSAPNLKLRELTVDVICAHLLDVLDQEAGRRLENMLVVEFDDHPAYRRHLTYLSRSTGVSELSRAVRTY